jgi:hypothetical protein
MEWKGSVDCPLRWLQSCDCENVKNKEEAKESKKENRKEKMKT